MSVFRSKKYMDWVKTQPSYIDCDQADDPHHIHGVHGLGGSVKPHDLFTIPLTRRQHTEAHAAGAESYFKDRGCTQAEAVIKTIDRAIRDGVIEIKVNL